MNEAAIKDALADISAEQDPTLKALKMASLCSTVFREHNVELVVVGGSAIELLTEGAYTSGDLDLCSTGPVSITLRERQEIMGILRAEGGPRSWQVAGLYVDLLGPVETLARTPFRTIEGPFGPVKLVQPEELLAERILVSVYPQAYPPAEKCARTLVAAALQNHVRLDWAEVRRIADLPAYRILPQCETLVKKIADELGTKNPFDSNR